MNRFVVALSAVVSGRSAWLLLGFTGLAYAIGFAAVWSAVGYIVVEMLLFLFYAPRIRDFSEEHDCVTVPDFFAARFNDKSGFLRILLVVVFLVFMLTYVAAQFVAGGKAFSAYFEISPVAGLLITATIVLIYTILGGFLAASLTDVLQALVMLVALIALPIIGILNVGGWDVIEAELSLLPQLHQKAHLVIPGTEGNLLSPAALSFGALVGALGIGLGSPGNPHIIVRYMSIKDSRQFRWTAIVGTLWNILLAGGALFIGIVGRAYFSEIATLPDGDPEKIFVALAQNLLSPVFIGVLLAAVFAAIMSTADSQLLVAASSIVRDIYQKIMRRNVEIKQETLSLYSRFFVSILVILAVVLAIWVQDLVFWFVLFAWAGLGAAVGPTSILALFWKKTTKGGVIAGILTGTVVVFVWKLIAPLSMSLYELIPAFFASLFMTFLVSLIENRLKK